MVKRDLYMKKISPFIDTPVVKVITGIRRCGKSVFMEQIRLELIKRGVPEKQILFLNLESQTDTRVRDLDSVLQAVKSMAPSKRKRVYLFLDEVQELLGWETMINSFLVDFNIDIYITGSNAYMLSGELSTYLAGRYVEIKMYPFSFAEVTRLYKQQKSPLSESKIFQVFLIKGGFPFLYQYQFSQSDTNQYIADIFDSIILKDIAQRNKVRDIAQLRQLVLFFLANAGNTFSASSLVKYMKNEKRNVATETIYNYIEYCRSACFPGQILPHGKIWPGKLFFPLSRKYI